MTITYLSIITAAIPLAALPPAVLAVRRGTKAGIRATAIITTAAFGLSALSVFMGAYLGLFKSERAWVFGGLFLAVLLRALQPDPDQRRAKELILSTLSLFGLNVCFEARDILIQIAGLEIALWPWMFAGEASATSLNRKAAFLAASLLLFLSAGLLYSLSGSTDLTGISKVIVPSTTASLAFALLLVAVTAKFLLVVFRGEEEGTGATPKIHRPTGAAEITGFAACLLSFGRIIEISPLPNSSSQFTPLFLASAVLITGGIFVSLRTCDSHKWCKCSITWLLGLAIFIARLLIGCGFVIWPLPLTFPVIALGIPAAFMMPGRPFNTGIILEGSDKLIGTARYILHIVYILISVVGVLLLGGFLPFPGRPPIFWFEGLSNIDCMGKISLSPHEINFFENHFLWLWIIATAGGIISTARFLVISFKNQVPSSADSGTGPQRHNG